ncbi:MAG: biotin synthase BioB [Gammaproteobacteria bacterium]|nr:biotin synthase BioB [Gammaproteobacteria bacterium]MBL6819308.1 biotin synthase BioB [Gammaproteobacteria bacterium]MBL6898487.1 biotin synthase BioB [Gammaproteobacteria bacterium]
MNKDLKKWPLEEIEDLYRLPFNDLIFKAQTVHREHHDPNKIQISTLMSIKTGGCPEDCKYCSQSIKYNTDVEIEKLLSVDEVIDQAKAAKASGASRFCMGAAWRNLNDSNLEKIKGMVKAVKDLKLETCLTLGMLKKEQAESLKECGLDYYNHNLDSSEEYYSKVVSTRTYQDRLNTLGYVRDAGIKVCTGGILGLGEENIDRLKLIEVLCNMEEQPESVPMNKLVKIDGTPYSENENVDNFDFIRIIAISRITMPKTFVRLSAGRDSMNDEMQALCFFAGANSIFYGDELLTTKNSSINHDKVLMDKLNIKTL